MTARLYAATRKGLFVYAHEAKGWRVVGRHFVGDPVTMVLPDARDGSVYAALKLGHFGAKVWRSADAGATWQERAVPTYPKVAGEDDKPSAGKSLEQIWSMEIGAPGERATLWAGTIPGGLFRSKDGAESWELVHSLWDRPERREWFGGGYDQPGIHSICVDPRDAKRVAIGVSCGGVWITQDDAHSWQPRTHGMRAAYMPPERAFEPNVQDPHRVVQCAAAPDVYWTQHHNGIFRSVDGAQTWQEIEQVKPSVFGFAVAVHPRDPDLAWFVPAVKDECRVPVDGRVVVTRTRDGGKSFETLSRGLPQQDAYDLAYRHGLDIDARGEWLAMGSTTGGLWVSGNHGDSWECLSAHLPPVYALRFG